MVSLAIVIPYYKNIFFEETLISLCNQTNKNFTVYIGNDGSPYDPLPILSKYSEKLNFHYEEFDHIGYIRLSRHWDRCMAMTRDEEWVQILGDDDILDPNFVERFYEISATLNKDINLIHFNKKIIDQDNKEVIQYPSTVDTGIVKSKDLYMLRLQGKRSLTLSENVFRKSSYLKYGFVDFPVAFGTDVILFLEYSELNYVYYDNDRLVSFRISDHNLSNINDSEINIHRNRSTYDYRLYLIKKYKDVFTFSDKKTILRTLRRKIAIRFLSQEGRKQNLELLRALI